MSSRSCAMLPGWWLAALAWAGPVGSPAEVAEVAEVTVVPFFGEEGRGLEAAVIDALDQEGLAWERATASAHDAARCDQSLPSATCAEPIVARWRAQPSPERFLVLGWTAPVPQGTDVEVWIFDRDADDAIATRALRARAHDGDLILPMVMPGAVARTIVERLDPPMPPTRAEVEALMRLDEPSEDERLEEIDDCILGCCYPAPPPVDYEDLRVDLHDDFVEFCAVRPARGRAWYDEPADPRPLCRRGPVLGYVRPRTWTAASVLVVSAGATALAFGQRAAGWDTAGIVLGPHRLGASLTTWGTTAAITTGLLAVGTVVLAISDRRRARRFILREKQRRWLLDHQD